MTEKPYHTGEELLAHVINEPGAEYSIGNNNSARLYVDPFDDCAFKRIFALKHASKMREEPQFLKAPGLADFFYLAKYANLTKEELNMYREAQKIAWDNYSIMESVKESAKESGKEEGREEGALGEKKVMVLEMLKSGIDITVIATCSKLSIEEIIALRNGDSN